MITTSENLHNHGPILFFGFSDSAEAVTNKIPDVFTARNYSVYGQHVDVVESRRSGERLLQRLDEKIGMAQQAPETLGEAMI